MRLHNAGFTLVELLVALTITGIITGSVVKMFTSMSFGYTTQNSRADLQQSIRAVTDLMSREIRMAGFSEHGGEEFGIALADTNSLAIIVDWDNDGYVTASHSDDPAVLQESDLITYTMQKEDKSLRRITAVGTGSESSQALIGGSGDHMLVEDLSFRYFNQQGRETAALADIRGVEISITAGTPAGRKGILKKTYRTKIMCRNLGL